MVVTSQQAKRRYVMQSVMQEVKEVQGVPAPPAPPVEPKKDRKGALKWGAIGLGVIVVLGVGGAAVQASRDVLPSSSFVQPGTGDSHSVDVLAVQQVMGNWYLDRSGGTPFRVLDGDGTVLATGMLSEPVDGGDGATYGLVGPIEIARASIEVPDAAFFQLEVQSVGGTVTFDKTELAANGWEMAFIAG